MPADACPLPSEPNDDEQQVLCRLVKSPRITVVGMSDDPMKPSHYVPRYMLDHGHEIIPVNPNHQSILGMRCYASLEEVPGEIDLVNVFRRPAYCPDVVRSAIRVKARAVWLQSGIRSAQARELAEQAGLAYVEDHCLMVEHIRASRGS